MEREVPVGDIPLKELLAGPHHRSFTFSEERRDHSDKALLNDATAPDVPDLQPLYGAVELSVKQCDRQLFKVTVRVLNRSTLDNAASINRDEALLRSLASTHAIVKVRTASSCR